MTRETRAAAVARVIHAGELRPSQRGIEADTVNALLHEHLFGHTPKQQGGGFTTPAGFTWPPIYGWWRSVDGVYVGMVGDEPNYYEEIAAAWRVVEAMGGAGPALASFEAQLQADFGAGVPLWALPEAKACRHICYAAVRALGLSWPGRWPL